MGYIATDVHQQSSTCSVYDSPKFLINIVRSNTRLIIALLACHCKMALNFQFRLINEPFRKGTSITYLDKVHYIQVAVSINQINTQTNRHNFSAAHKVEIKHVILARCVLSLASYTAGYC